MTSVRPRPRDSRGVFVQSEVMRRRDMAAIGAGGCDCEIKGMLKQCHDRS